MYLKKKIISLAAALGVITSALTFGGCNSSDRKTPLTVDGTEIPAGLYILYSGSAYAEAKSKFAEENPTAVTSAGDFDYHSQTVEGKPFDQYVKDKALENCVRHVSIERLYSKAGKSLTEDEKKDLDAAVETQWECDLSVWTSSLSFAKGYDTLGAYYEHIGVAKSSLKSFYNVNQFKAGAVFDSIYGEGGSKEVSADEINKYIDENYVLTRYFAISLKDDEGSIIDDKDKLAELEKLANDYAKELNGGTAYKDVYAKYQDYLKEDKEEDSALDSSENKEEPKDTDYNRVVNKEDTSPSEEFVSSLFSQAKNTTQVFKADDYYYVVQKLDILTESKDDVKYTDTYKDISLRGLKSDEFEDDIKAELPDPKTDMASGVPDYCKEQAENASNALSAVDTINYMTYYYSGLMGGAQ